MQNIPIETTPNDNPQSGSIYVYPKDDNYLYSKDSNGNEKKIGGNSITLTSEYPLTGGTSEGTIGLVSSTIGSTKTKITYNSKGLVVSGTTLSDSDVPVLNSASSGYLKYNGSAFEWSNVPTLEEPVNYAVLEGIPSPNNSGLYDGEATTTWTKLRRNLFNNVESGSVLYFNPYIHRNIEIITNQDSTGIGIGFTGGTTNFYYDGCTVKILIHVFATNNDGLFSLTLPTSSYKNGTFTNLTNGIHIITVNFFGGYFYWKIEHYI